jgi:hypothetical protein
VHLTNPCPPNKENKMEFSLIPDTDELEDDTVTSEDDEVELEEDEEDEVEVIDVENDDSMPSDK